MAGSTSWVAVPASAPSRRTALTDDLARRAPSRCTGSGGGTLLRCPVGSAPRSFRLSAEQGSPRAALPQIVCFLALTLSASQGSAAPVLSARPSASPSALSEGADQLIQSSAAPDLPPPSLLLGSPSISFPKLAPDLEFEPPVKRRSRVVARHRSPRFG